MFSVRNNVLGFRNRVKLEADLGIGDPRGVLLERAGPSWVQGYATSLPVQPTEPSGAPFWRPRASRGRVPKKDIAFGQDRTVLLISLHTVYAVQFCRVLWTHGAALAKTSIAPWKAARSASDTKQPTVGDALKASPDSRVCHDALAKKDFAHR